MTTAKRLKTIEIQANGNLVRAYALTYTASTNTNRSRLNSVQQFVRCNRKCKWHINRNIIFTKYHVVLAGLSSNDFRDLDLRLSREHGFWDESR